MYRRSARSRSRRASLPQFDFAEAELRARGEGILAGIAQCMKQGALQGEKVTLVGHADPRGPDAYNQRLGMARAAAARDYLASQGVAVSSLALKSRGERDASGTGPASWQLDRPSKGHRSTRERQPAPLASMVCH